MFATLGKHFDRQNARNNDVVHMWLQEVYNERLLNLHLAPMSLRHNQNDVSH